MKKKALVYFQIDGSCDDPILYNNADFAKTIFDTMVKSYKGAGLVAYEVSNVKHTSVTYRLVDGCGMRHIEIKYVD